MSMFDELKALGVNVEEGTSRLMDNVSLYQGMLGKFAVMMRNPAVQPDFSGGETMEIIEKAHTIKGITGNLSISPLYEAYSEIVRLLREDQPDQAQIIYENILPVQEKIISCIEKNM